MLGLQPATETRKDQRKITNPFRGRRSTPFSYLRVWHCKTTDGFDGGFVFMSKRNPVLKEYIVFICDACYELEGDMCHTPGCIFIRKTMAEVSDYLDSTSIRPIIDGQRYRLGTTLDDLARDGIIVFKRPIETETIFN